MIVRKKYMYVLGAFGIDFTHNCGEGLEIVKKGLLQFGVTGFCPTIVSTNSSNYHKVSIALNYLLKYSVFNFLVNGGEKQIHFDRLNLFLI